ncbi:hypothetical protein [Aeromicrobium sp.]|uniref:hypothetical protein n=1 Tax=Aeromicrobium sp. TaxID=1871063 RepID=UPI0030C6425D
MNGRPSPEAIERAARTLVLGRQAAAQMTPREQAEAAHEPGGPSVDELEARIRRRRGLPPIAHEEVVDD